MSFIDSVVSSVAKAVTDPGELVKDAVNTVLPKNLAVVGDVAGALVDLEVPGHQLQALQHGLAAVRDLPQAMHTAANGAATAGAWCGGTPAFEPPPPPRACPTSGGAWRAAPGSGTWSPARPPTSAPPGTVGAPLASVPANPTAPTAATAAAPGDLNQLLGMSDADFMNTIRNGKIPDSVTKDPSAMLAIQDRMNRITQMNQLMTSMLQAMHQMQMAIIQNVRA
jgi:hypothetical protein